MDPDINEAEVYAEFMELAKEIHVPVLQLHHALEVTKGGEVIEDLPRTMSHSFNRNAFVWMFTQLGSHPLDDTGNFGASYTSAKDTGGTVRNHATAPFYGNSAGTTLRGSDIVTLGYNAVVGVSDNGIVVGTGGGAEGFSDYQLTTQIAHGNDPTEIHYSDTSVLKAWDEDNDTMTATYIRYFNNNSGGTIVVTEIAMYFEGMGSTYNFMMARDLLVASISAIDASQLKVTYTISLVYPEGA